MSIPSVAMRLGTLRTVTMSPLTRPTAAPIASMARITHQVASASLPSSIEEPMTVSVMSEPTERSKPPDTMT